MERIRKPEEVCPKHPRRVSPPTAPIEEKRKKRRLRRLSSLDHGTGPSAPVCDEVPAEVLPEVDPNGCAHAEVDPNGCGRTPAVVRIYDEDDEEEEVPLIRKKASITEVVRGIVTFLLQLYQPLSAFRNYQ
jgi:hypothetical protein